MAMKEEIKVEFEKGGFAVEDEEILKKCLTFCINYSLRPSDLVSSWEVYYLNRQLDVPIVQNSQMEGFLMHLQNEQKEAITKEEPGLHSYSSKDVDIFEYAKEDILCSPMDRSEKLSPEPFDSMRQTDGHYFSSGKPSKLVTPFGQRTDKFAVKLNINNLPDSVNGQKENDNENLEDDIIRRVQPRKPCSLIVHGSGPEPGCRFMYDRIEDKFNALEKRIRKHTTALIASGLYEEPMDPAVASQIN